MGTLLYFAQAIDPTLATALSSIAAWQAKGTQAVQQACNQLLDYVVTHPHASLKFIASDMILAVDTDASYLSKPYSKSWASDYFFLTHHDNPNTHNAHALNLSTIIRHVLASANEAYSMAANKVSLSELL